MASREELSATGVQGVLVVEKWFGKCDAHVGYQVCEILGIPPMALENAIHINNIQHDSPDDSRTVSMHSNSEVLRTKASPGLED